jgi:hypothetical protein
VRDPDRLAVASAAAVVASLRGGRGAVAAQERRGERVLGVERGRVARHPAGQRVERAQLSAAALDQRPRKPAVVDVLMRDDDALEILDAMPEGREPRLQIGERGRRALPGVDQRQRVVLDQVDVHRADGPGRGDRDARDAANHR